MWNCVNLAKFTQIDTRSDRTHRAIKEATPPSKAG